MEDPYFLLDDPNNRNVTLAFRGTVQDKYILHIKKDLQEQMGEPGLIDCLLYYSANGVDYNVEHISVQVGTNKLGTPDFSNVDIQINNGEIYTRDSITYSNPNDFIVVPVFGISVEDGGYYIKRDDLFYSKLIISRQLQAGEQNGIYEIGGTAWFRSTNNEGPGTLHDENGNTTHMIYDDRILKSKVEVLYLLKYITE